MSEVNFETMRRSMVDSQLRTSGVTDPAVLAAMGAVARESFVPDDRAGMAYIDRRVPLGAGRALNPPVATALLLEALAPRSDDKILVIGAATGYAAALLGQIGAAVIALEEDKTLADFAGQALAGHAHVSVVNAPLAEGWARGGLYDAILIDGAVAHVPDAIKAQLKDGGRIAAGIIERGVTRLASGRKAGDALALTDFLDADAVVLPGFDNPSGFVF
nr:protein-L-isoaspartate O-methyltransferase [Sphingobium boeckii]